jgi:hypothetical protein
MAGNEVIKYITKRCFSLAITEKDQELLKKYQDDLAATDLLCREIIRQTRRIRELESKISVLESALHAQKDLFLKPKI